MNKRTFDLAAAAAAVVVFGVAPLIRLWAEKRKQEGSPGFGLTVAQVAAVAVG